jgi:hypothetical protein
LAGFATVIRVSWGDGFLIVAQVIPPLALRLKTRLHESLKRISVPSGILLILDV